jgi:hypothetical protein
METVDLSRSGAFIRTDAVIPVGSQLQLTFVVPERDLEVDLFARVVRVVDAATADARETEPGVGVEFVDPPASFVALVDDLLAPASAADAAASRVRPMEFIEAANPDLLEEDGPTQQMGQDWWKGSLDDLRGDLKSRQTQHRRQLVEQIRAEYSTSGGGAPKDENGPDFQFKTAEKLYEAGDVVGARQIAQDLMTEFPDNLLHSILFHLASARIAKEKGSLEEAVVHWKQATSIDSHCEEAVRELRGAGMSEKKQKRFFADIWSKIQAIFQ